MLNGELYNLRKNQTDDYSYFWATGWGKFSDTSVTSNYLMQIELPFIANDLCRGIYNKYSTYNITENMICAGPQG